MAYPLLDINQNFEHQKRIKEELGLSEQVYFYHSAAAALQEVLTGLLQFLPHKKSIAVIKGNSDLIHWVLPQLFRQNYQVQIYQLDGKEDFSHWMQNLKTDTSCLLFASNHPITGESFELKAQALQMASAQRLPVIQLNHSGQILSFTEESPSMACVHQLQNGRAIIQASPRFRFYAPMHLAHAWSEVEIEQFKSQIYLRNNQKNLFDGSVQASRIKNLPKGFQQIFLRKTENINLYHPELTGDLILKELSELAPTESPMTTHFCHHGQWTNWSDWWSQAPSSEILRGLLSCPYSFYSSEENWSKLHQAAQNALQRQSWF